MKVDHVTSRHSPRTPNIKVAPVVIGDLLTQVWSLYSDLFRELDTLAVQRHLMSQDEFTHVMTNPRVDKYLCFDPDDRLCGLSTLTNDLAAVPLVSSAYFQRRWPGPFAERRVYYVGFVAVHPDGSAVNAFTQLVTAMQLVVAAHRGVVGLDMCRYNDDQRRMSRSVNALVRRVSSPSGVSIERADEQIYMLYDFTGDGS